MKTLPRSRYSSRAARRGAASVELAGVLSMLCFLCVATCDYARVCKTAVVVANAARNGALYASDSTYAASSGYGSVTDAALADASDLSPTPSVSTTSGTDSSGNKYNDVTVTYNFNTVVNYPGIPSTLSIARTVRMATASN